MSHRVIVLGGGVAGMSAAHELAERNFQVTVYDKGRIPGGKARSFGVANTAMGTRRDLPAEHGFRFFPGFYQHLPDTMKRIPYRNRPDGVFGNLVPATQMAIQFNGRQHIVLPARFPRSLQEIRSVLHAANYLTTLTGLTADDIAFYSERVWQLLTSSEERRAAEFEGVDWWNYIDADNKDRTDVYRAYLGSSPRVLVAADPKVANTKTVGDILLQLLFNLVDPGVSADRVLNGPTNDVWIDPWLAHLRWLGVRYEHESEVTGIRCDKDDNRIAAVTVRRNGQDREVTADFYVAALPVEKMAKLLTPRLLALDPTLEGIQTLAGHVDWMSGIQYYLVGEPAFVYGHQMHLGSPWALTSISQAQFWHPEGDFRARYGDGTVRTVLSVDVSDWKKPAPRPGGQPPKAARDYTSTDEIARVVWGQLRDSVAGGLDDRLLHPKTPWHVDPAIHLDRQGKLDNDEPLLVNRKDSWELRPWARTRIPNLFLASDYVRTFTNLATMEAANEAARRAVNAILDEAGSNEPPCDVWELHEPVWVKPWRWWDLQQYRAGRPWTAELPGFVEAMARGILESAPAIGGPEGYADATARETAERGMPLVPEYVQNQVANMIEEVQVALEEGDGARLRSFFVPGVLDSLNAPGPPTMTTRWVRDVTRRIEKGQRIAIDVRSLEEIRPMGPDVLVRITFDTVALGETPERVGGPGQFELLMVPGEIPESHDAGRLGQGWLIRRATYSPV